MRTLAALTLLLPIAAHAADTLGLDASALPVTRSSVRVPQGVVASTFEAMAQATSAACQVAGVLADRTPANAAPAPPLTSDTVSSIQSAAAACASAALAQQQMHAAIYVK